MTFIAGYIHKSAAHIVVDSATTISRSYIVNIPDKLDRTYSSLGESPHITDEQIVLEADLKIYNIENKILVAFAGIVSEGTRVVEDLTIQHKTHPNISCFLTKYFSQNTLRQTEYIIAFQEAGLPCLYFHRPNGDSQLIRGQRCLILGGTNTNNIYRAVDSALDCSFHNNYSQQETLISVITILQSMTMHFQTIRSSRNGYNVGIGGHYNGAIIHPHCIEWAADTAHLFYSARNWNRGEKWFMFRYNRDNSTFIIGDRLKRLFTHERGENRQALLRKWANPLTDLAISCSCDFVSFISYDRRNIVIVNNDNDKVNRVKFESGKLEIQSDSAIARHLFTYTSDQPGGPQSGFDVYTNFVDT